MQLFVPNDDDLSDKTNIFTVCPVKDSEDEYLNIDISSIKNKKDFIMKSLLVLAGLAIGDPYLCEKDIASNSTKITSFMSGAPADGFTEIRDFFNSSRKEKFFSKPEMRNSENMIAALLIWNFCLIDRNFFQEHFFGNLPDDNTNHNYDTLQLILKNLKISATATVDPNTTNTNITTTPGFDTDKCNILFEAIMEAALAVYKDNNDLKMLKILSKIRDAAKNKDKAAIRAMRKSFDKTFSTQETILPYNCSFVSGKLTDNGTPPDPEQVGLYQLRLGGLGAYDANEVKAISELMMIVNRNGKDIFYFPHTKHYIKEAADGTYELYRVGTSDIKEGGKLIVDGNSKYISFDDGSFVCVGGRHTSKMFFAKTPDNVSEEQQTKSGVLHNRYGAIQVIGNDGSVIRVEGFLEDKDNYVKGPFKRVVAIFLNGERITGKNFKDPRFNEKAQKKAAKVLQDFNMAYKHGIQNIYTEFKRVGVDFLQNENDKIKLDADDVLKTQLQNEKKDTWLEHKQKEQKKRDELDKQKRALQIDFTDKDRRIRNGEDVQQDKDDETKKQEEEKVQQQLKQLEKIIKEPLPRKPTFKVFNESSLSLWDRFLDFFRTILGLTTVREEKNDSITRENAITYSKWEDKIRQLRISKSVSAEKINKILSEHNFTINNIEELNQCLQRDQILVRLSDVVLGTSNSTLNNLNSTRGRRRGRGG